MNTLLRRIVLSLLCGAIATVAVAWRIALSSSQTSAAANAHGVVLDPHDLTAQLPIYFIMTFERRNYRAMLVRATGESTTPITRQDFLDLQRSMARQLSMRDVSSLEPAYRSTLELPAWLHLPSNDRPERSGWGALNVGWPEFALVSYVEEDGPVTHDRGALRIFAASKYPWGGPSAGTIPLIPIWPGFAINTLIFAAPSFVGLNALGLLRTIRASRRRRASVCTHCGYSLKDIARATACPECGKPTPYSLQHA